jgi:hypothetical protein
MLATILVVGSGASPAPAAVLPVIAVVAGDRQTSIVVDLGVGRTPTGTAEVMLAGTPQPATVTPVLADDLSMALVVDASEAGGPALPAWLSAATRFVLEGPAQARAVVVADTTPPSVIAAKQPGAIGVVGALNTVRAGGRRSTSDALTLAIDRVRAAPTGPRLVMLYTTAPDAGGEKAAALAARLTAAGTTLVVIGPASGGTYWSDVGRPTGGFFAPADLPVVVPALDRVTTTLRGRYVVTFPTPQALPAPLTVRMGVGGVTLTADTVLAAKATAPPPAPGVPTVVWASLVTALLVAAVLLLATRRTGKRAPRDSPPPDSPPPVTPPPVTPPPVTPPPVTPAQTSVPPVARGRASVPGARSAGRRWRP